MADLHASARAMAVLTVVSRLTGFLRVAVFTAVFAETFLANTYISANTVPNILFELFAAGALQAVLVPAMVRLSGVGDGSDAEAEHVAGSVLGLLCGGLALIGVVAVAAGPWLMGVLVDDVPDPVVRAQVVDLGAVFLWFFMPQLVFYGANVVATAVLNARDRFALPVFAPTLNNVVVIGCYLWFAAVHEGRPSLELTTAELWILGGGTTLGVVVFCSLPVLAVARTGFRLRPRWDHRHPAVRALARDGAWAGAFLALSQITQVVVLKVANRAAGAPTVYQFAFILFTLPHALFSVPVMTTRFPEMSRAAQAGDGAAYGRSVALATRSIGYLALGATALSIAVAHPGAALLAYGDGRALAPEIARATVAFAPGIVGFGLLLMYTRALYATGDARTPALVNLGVVTSASVLMLVGVTRLDDADLVTGLAAVSSVTLLGGAAVLGWLVAGRVGATGGGRLGVAPALARDVAAAAVAVVAGSVVSGAIGWDDRVRSAVAVAAGAVVAGGVYVVGNRVLGGPAPRLALATMGTGERA